MFQVASHPTQFSTRGHRDAHHIAPCPPSSPAVQLPRQLARPQFSEVSADAIAAASPELANVPAEYIRRGLRPKAPSMLAGLSAIPSSHMPNALPRSHVPAMFSIPLRTPISPSSPTYPSHVLAVSASKSSHDNQALIFPIHSIVLASHCAQLPRLPTSHQKASQQSLHLPVLPLSLPSAPAFKILHSFMYTHRLDSVLKGLFPMPTGFLDSLSHETVQATLSSSIALHQLASYLCSSASGNLHTLTAHASHVKELWQDMVALGIHDPELWDTVDLAWEVILGALNLAASGQ